MISPLLLGFPHFLHDDHIYFFVFLACFIIDVSVLFQFSSVVTVPDLRAASCSIVCQELHLLFLEIVHQIDEVLF